MDLLEATPGAPIRRHPWEMVRADFFSRILREEGLLREGTRALDVGAGDAWLAARFAQEFGGAVTCVDPAYAHLPPPAYPRLSFSAALPAGARFELALLLDVLEHVEDDEALLGTVVREHLTPGGAILVSVPAWTSLFSEHDRALLHHRRYAPGAARRLLGGAGLRIERCGALFPSLAALRALAVLAERLRPAWSIHGHAGNWDHVRLITALVSSLLAVDASLCHLAARAALPIPGLSWWALCRRPS